MNKAFTLIELIVVIAIIAILAAVIVPNAFRAIEKAKISASIEDYRSIKTAAMSYYADTGQWPATCPGSGAGSCGTVAGGFIIQPTVAAPILGWDGPYIEKWANPAKWNSGAYNYTNNAPAGGGQIFCLGCGNANERFVTITLVPSDNATNRGAAQMIDRQTDGVVDGLASAVRWAGAGNQDVRILISRDGAVQP